MSNEYSTIGQPFFPFAVAMAATSWLTVAMVKLVSFITPDQFAQWGAAIASVLVALGLGAITVVRYWQSTAVKEPNRDTSESYKPLRRGSNMRDDQNGPAPAK